MPLSYDLFMVLHGVSISTEVGETRAKVGIMSENLGTLTKAMAEVKNKATI